MTRELYNRMKLQKFNHFARSGLKIKRVSYLSLQTPSAFKTAWFESFLGPRHGQHGTPEVDTRFPKLVKRPRPFQNGHLSLRAFSIAYDSLVRKQCLVLRLGLQNGWRTR